MLNLTNPSVVRGILDKHNFSFKKSLGQNFLIDSTVCPRMAQEAIPNDSYGAIEIGPGVGVLTAELSKRAKKVVAIEIDERLKPVLETTLSECDNTKVIFGDVCKLDLKKIIEEEFGGMQVVVCANLPYYITSPIIMSLLKAKLPIEALVVMVQKEAAERLAATIGSRDAGAVSVAVSFYSQPHKLFGVPRGSFLPSPKVDSEVIRLDILKEPPVAVRNEKFFFGFVKAAFAQRRKTLANSVSSVMGIPKQRVEAALCELGLAANSRVEALEMEQLAALSDALCD